MKVTTRRAFLARTSMTAAGLAAVSPFVGHAVEPFQRPGKPRLLSSLAAYSFRDYFKVTNSKKEVDSARRIDLFQFIDFCVDQGLDGTELTSYYFPADTNADFLIKLKRHAFMRGIAISGTSVGNTFTHPPGEARDREIATVRRWIDFAAIMGAPHIRVFAGAAGKLSPAEAKANCIGALEECGEYAGRKGVFLGVENHGGIVAEPAQLLEIIKTVKCPWIGINLDSGNFQTDDPYADLARCAPYAVNVQIKVEIKRRGAAAKELSDLPRLVKILRDANYQGFVALEYEAAEDPWKAVPEWLKRMQDAFKS